MVPVPVRGLYDNVDPTSPNFPDDAAADLLNYRTSVGRWEPRRGASVFAPTIGSGTQKVQLLDTVYTAAGAVFRVGVRAGVFYDQKVGTDTNYVAIPAWAALHTTNLYAGVQMLDSYYVTDRNTTLKRVDIADASSFVTVAQPVAPSVAPTVKATYWGILEDWRGSATFNWTETANSDFDLLGPSGSEDFDAPGSDTTMVRVRIRNTAARGDRIYNNIPSELAPSKTIAFWVRSNHKDAHYISLAFGQNNRREFNYSQIPFKKNRWYPYFVEIGDMGTVSFKEFWCTHSGNAASDDGETGVLYYTKFYLPGRLDGLYRWRFTHYDPVTGGESEPSPVSNDGAPLDLSVDGIRYKDETEPGFRKAAVMDGASDAATVAGTTKKRWYRNGGVADLTKDSSGQDVWALVGTTIDLLTTLDGAVSASATSVILTAITIGGTQLAHGDVLVFERGSPTLKEYGFVRDYVIEDLVVAANMVDVTSANRPFVASDVGRTLNVKGQRTGTGFTVPGTTRTITGVVGVTATLDGAVSSGAATTGIATLSAVSATTRSVLLHEPLVNAHGSGTAVDVGFLDNVANEAVDSSQRLEIERDDPPTGAKWIAKVDSELWIFGWTADPSGVARSNRATPFRPKDYEVFPDGVDPLTRRHETQGWRFRVGHGETIEWGGFFQGVPTILTRMGCFQVTARSQADWGPWSVVERFRTGCIEDGGHTVCEANGALYWVAPGPHVMRWDGQSAPQNISQDRVGDTLSDAGTYSQWFSRWRRDPEYGTYFHLWITPTGASTNTKRLDYNIDLDSWEPCSWNDSAGAAIAFTTAHVQPNSNAFLAGSNVSGTTPIYQLEDQTQITDNSVAIAVRAKSKRFPLTQVHKAENAYLRSLAATDTLTLSVRMGGSEYAESSQDYTLAMSGTLDKEVKKRLHRTLRGRWCQTSIAGSVSNRVPPREAVIELRPVREGRISA